MVTRLMPLVLVFFFSFTDAFAQTPPKPRPRVPKTGGGHPTGTSASPPPRPRIAVQPATPKMTTKKLRTMLILVQKLLKAGPKLSKRELLYLRQTLPQVQALYTQKGLSLSSGFSLTLKQQERIFKQAQLARKVNNQYKNTLKSAKQIIKQTLKRQQKSTIKGLTTAASSVLNAGNIGAEVLQVLGRIVIKRATAAAFELITKQLKKALGCKEPLTHPFAFRYTCQLLDKVNIKTLATSPQPLLAALFRDVMENLLERLERHSNEKVRNVGKAFKNVLKQLDKLDFSMLLQKIADAWRHGKSEAVAKIVVNHLNAQMVKLAEETQCKDVQGGNAQPYLQALWVVSQCAIETREAKPIADFSKQISSCNVKEKASSCSSSQSQKQTIERMSAILLSMMSVDINGTKQSERAKKIAKPILQFFFFTAREVIKKKSSKHVILIDGLEAVFQGILDKDWVTVIGGISTITTSAIDLLLKAKVGGENLKTRKKLFVRALRLVSAIGQYAATYLDDKLKSKSTEELQKVRQNIIENLIDTVTDRTSRESGAVISLGGSFGLLGGIRLSASGKSDNPIALNPYGPFALPLGIGLQTYGEGKVGLHLQMSFFDLGQYVVFEGTEGDVQLPKFEDAFSLSLTAGIWFRNMSKSVPFFLAIHAGVSPFQVKNKIPTFYAGLFFGAYVPFFDFN